jgi:hypothetical protein
MDAKVRWAMNVVVLDRVRRRENHVQDKFGKVWNLEEFNEVNRVRVSRVPRLYSKHSRSAHLMRTRGPAGMLVLRWSFLSCRR